ncbi:MAG: hypothetical protein AAGM67_09685, partial [Bacteroidota bacterium]
MNGWIVEFGLKYSEFLQQINTSTIQPSVETFCEAAKSKNPRHRLTSTNPAKIPSNGQNQD